MKSAVLVFICLILSACGSVSGPPEAADPTTFWPAEPENFDDLTAAVARIQDATGRFDLEVAPGGVDVAVLNVVTVAGAEACGGTFQRALSKTFFVQILRTAPEGKFCATHSDTMTHELMHVLTDSGEHAEDGIFARVATPAPRITDSSLSKLCEGFDCTAFRPE